MRTATQKITGPLNIQGLERAQKVVDLSFSCLMRIEKLGMVPKILSCLNISKPQANTIGPYLVYSLDYHNVSPGLRLLDCQVFQWENQRARDKRFPKTKKGTIINNSAVAYIGEVLTRKPELL